MSDTNPSNVTYNAAPAPKPDTASVVANIVRQHFTPQILDVRGQKGQESTQILVLPDGAHGLRATGVKDFLDPYRTSPERRKGTAKLTDMDSLIQHVNRFKDADTVLFADDNRDGPSLQAVLNYHRAGSESDPRFGDHRALYQFPLSDEWMAWRGVDGSPMEQLAFAEFLEDRILDVMNPPGFLNTKDGSNAAGKDVDAAEDGDAKLLDMVEKIGGKVCGPARLMELSKGLQIHDKQTVKQVVNTNTGEAQIQFESEHHDKDGKPISVPNLFLLAIPVFHNGPLYRIPVRLRYRTRGGMIIWSFTMHRPDLAQDHAFNEACQKAAADTGLPLLMGAPE